MFNLKKKIMTTTKPPTPVRPLDPAWLYEFLSAKKLDEKMIKQIVAALGRYNEACNLAAKNFEKDLKNLNKV